MELLAYIVGQLLVMFLNLPPWMQLAVIFVASRLFAYRRGFKAAMRVIRDTNIEKERDLYRQRVKG